MTQITGAGETVAYGYETTFGTAATTIAKPFGFAVKVNPKLSRNYKEYYGTGDREALAINSKGYEGEVTIDGELSNSHLFKAILGGHSEAADTPAAGWYTHTYTADATVPSITIRDSYSTANTRFLLGGIVDSAKITVDTEEALLTFSSTIKYANESSDTTFYSTPTHITSAPFKITSAVAKIDSTTVNIKKADITITSNAELTKPVGSSYATSGVAKNLKYGIDVTFWQEDLTYVSDILAGTEHTLTIEVTGATNEKITFAFTGVVNDTTDKPSATSEDIITNDVNYTAKSLTVTGVDQTTF